MLNVSPVGRSCTQEERLAFLAHDTAHRVREKFIEALKANFPQDAYPLTYSIGKMQLYSFLIFENSNASLPMPGGQISIDIFPTGWDKSYCLQRLADDAFADIHFFGDKTAPVGRNKVCLQWLDHQLPAS